MRHVNGDANDGHYVTIDTHWIVSDSSEKIRGIWPGSGCLILHRLSVASALEVFTHEVKVKRRDGVVKGAAQKIGRRCLKSTAQLRVRGEKPTVEIEQKGCVWVRFHTHGERCRERPEVVKVRL